MGIRDRDYLRDWRPEDADLPQPERARKPWTWMTWLGYGSLLLLLLAIIAVAAL